ncbi:MAG TPA: T9SS type A sorting domain-containing protein, partial [Candidatus Marinimicrobia bacterium]|nr:T9SS type A sorting domain-containing protein [Candidatus Neomarinimicrobiota bacterium]
GNLYYTDLSFSAIYHLDADSASLLWENPGAGRYATLAPDGKMLAVKEIENGKERPALLDLEAGTIFPLSEAVLSCGQPSFSRDAHIAFTLGESLILLQDGQQREIKLPSYANLTPVSPDFDALVFNDDDDILWLMDLSSLEKFQISPDNIGSFYPQWSANGKFILYQGLAGQIFLYDIENSEIIFIDEGYHPVWHNDSGILYEKVQLDGPKVIESDIWRYELANRSLKNLTQSPNILEHKPYVSRDGMVFYFGAGEAIFRSDYLPLENKLDSPLRINLPRVESNHLSPAQKSSKSLDIPYVHQVYDTPDWHNGHWSCAPTAAIMVIAYYNLLPEWPTTCSWPSAHISNWGRYVTERYYYRETDYLWGANDPNSNTTRGGYGFMWGQGSPRTFMANYYYRHGFSAQRDDNPTWNKAIAEIDAGIPYTMCVMITSSGHLIIAHGKVEGQRTLIFNDPYGNKNTPGYPSYDGKDVYYDWPGYNHGYANLVGVAWTIPQHITPPAIADTLIDDLNFQNGFYLHTTAPASMANWKDQKSGYQNHFWYIPSHNGEQDIHYASWTPRLSNPGIYKVESWIPQWSDAATAARYQIIHQHGKDSIIINQVENDSMWAELGHYKFSATGKEFLYLGDGSPEGSGKLLFDAARWTLVNPLHAAFAIDTSLGYAPFNVTFTAIGGGAPQSYLWDLGNDSINEGNDSLFTGTYTSSGLFTPKLTVRDGDYSDWAIKEDAIRVLDSTQLWIYSIGDRPNDQGGFLQAHFLPSAYELSGDSAIYYVDADTGNGWFICDSLIPQNAAQYLWEIESPLTHFQAADPMLFIRLRYGEYAISDSFRVIVSDNLAPGIPQNLTADILNGNSVYLSWTAPDDADLAYFNIYRTKYSVVYPSDHYFLLSLDSCSFIDTTVTSGRAFRYVVTAVDIHENEGEPTPYVSSGIVSVNENIPRQFALLPPFPNPSNNQFTIPFELPDSGPAYLAIYDITGRKIWQQNIENAPSGRLQLIWTGTLLNGDTAPSGLYLLQLRSDIQVTHRKIILLK